LRIELSMSEERVIKKYANRRLYDAAQSRHITVDDIRNMIVAGTRVKVVEDKTNEDITRLILLQVIADQEQFGQPILSTPLLESLIRFYGNSLQGFLSAYLEKSVETFMRQQDSTLKKMGGTPSLAALSELTRQNLEIWAKMQESVMAAFTPPKGSAKAAAKEPARDVPPTPAGNGQDAADPPKL
jgi:polyhydroxyalkanoate synthesis repressor PhaR